MSNDDTPKIQETQPTITTPTVDINQIVKTAVDNAISSFKTQMTEAYQTKIAEAVQASHATIITPTEVEISDPNSTLDFVKKTLEEDYQERSKYGKFKTHMIDDMAKNKVLILKAAYPNLTAEEIHKELFES